MASFICGIKKEMVQMNLSTKQKRLTDLENELRIAEGRAGGWDSQGVWDQCVDSATFKMDNQQGPTVQRMELCPVFWEQSSVCNSEMYLPGWEGSLGENGCMYMAEALSCPPATITTLLTSYTLMQNKKF